MIMMPVRKYNAQNWLPGLFNELFDNAWMERTQVKTPAINVIESDKDYKVELAAPGMNKDDFQVTLGENDELVITMEKKNETKDEDGNGKKYLRREFSYSKFAQSFVLPENVDKEHIGAAMNDGVLTVSLPKRKPEEKEKQSRVIEIH